jgi:hypothetical protein
MTSGDSQMCNCVDKIDVQLAAKNTRIKHIFVINKDVGMAIGVETEKVDRSKRGKPVTMLAAFCPFCGRKL